MQYELQFNLQYIALLRVAILFWQKKQVANEVVEFFKICDTFNSDHDVRREWGEVVKMLMDEWNKDLLPKNVEIDLMHIIKMLGETILNWYQCIKYQYGLRDQAVNCINQICWTPYGTVDPVETFKSYWLNNPKINVIQLYDFACNFGVRDCIEHLWNKLPIGIHKDSGVIYENLDQHITAYWHSYVRNLDREDIHEFNLIYNPNRSTEENNLRLSIYQGSYLVAKYFWEKLTTKERYESVLQCARIAVLRNHFYCYENSCQNIKNYKSTQYVEICILLLNQMTEDQKRKFFNERIQRDALEVDHFNFLDTKDEILFMLLSTWPWQKLFIPVVKDIIQYHDDNSDMQCEFLDAITDRMLEDHYLGYPLNMSKYRDLLHEVWLMIPESVKRTMEPVTFGYDFVSNLINMWDLNSLKLILNDPATAVCRNELIELGMHSYDELIMKNQFEQLDEFADEMFQTEEEKQIFKKKRDALMKLISTGQFDLIDKFLGWQGSTLEEKQFVKKNLNDINICEFFIRKQDYNSFDKFLDWKFDTDEEKKKCKDYFKNLKFPISQMYRIRHKWAQDIVRMKYECSKFLYWLWESEEEVEKFKQAIIFNLGCNELFISALLDLRNDDVIDNCIS